MYIYMYMYVYISMYMYVYVRIYVYTFVYISIRVRWLRLVGSFKSYVSLAEYSHFYVAYLQKRPVILRSLLIAATPYLYLS